MKFLMTVKIPGEAGNHAMKTGAIPKKLEQILAEIKPEAAYFTTKHGMRTALLVVNMTDASQMPALAEPFFLAFNAQVSVTPVMTAEDLMKAGPAIQAAVKKYS